MFRMTANVLIGDFKAVKPNALSWNRSITNFSDSAMIKLPAMSMLKVNDDTYEKVQTGLQFKEGMKVEILAGYDGRNALRFKGFVSRINFTIPLEIECEGYSYQLRKKLNFTKSYKNTTVKKILQDLVEGTDIKISPKTVDIPLANEVFINKSGIEVLEQIKKNIGSIAIYFIYDTLYAHLLEITPETSSNLPSIKYRLGWNVIKDNDLKFNNKKEFADVRIVLDKRNKDGTKSKTKSGPSDGQEKIIKCNVEDPEWRQKIADQEKALLLNRGYEGSITAFLEPIFEPGMAVRIDDTKYPERTGKYFGVGVEGSLSSSGGRQKITIGNSLGNG